MDNNVSRKGNEGDIDLIEIFNNIFRWFRRCFVCLGKGIIAIIAFFFHNALFLIISIALGFGVSYILRQADDPIYQSEITLRNNTLDNADMISHFNQLGNMVTSKNTLEVASSLLISKEEANDLVDISAYWIIDINDDGIPDYVDYKVRNDPLDTINVRMSDRFVVEVLSKDPMNIDPIKEGILNYSGKHPLAESTNNLRINELNELIERTNIDIKELDSLQKVKYFEETRSRISEAGQIVLMQEQQTQMFYRDIQGLLSLRQSYEKELLLYPDVVTVISDFLPSSKRINTTFYYSKYTVPIAFCLTVILLILFKQRKKIIEILNRY